MRIQTFHLYNYIWKYFTMNKSIWLREVICMYTQSVKL